jgi:hypothetical protein
VTATAAGTLWYAYAVVQPADAVRAVLDGGLELVASGDVAVVVSPVDEREFGEEALPARLNDRAWVEQAVQSHERIVQRLLAVATVVPLRFGSLHRDRHAVEEFLRSHRSMFAESLDRVRGRVEVGLKVWLASEEPRPRASAPATGRQYLERQRAAREQRAGAAAELGDRLRTIHERLLGLADAGVLNRPQARELTGDSRRMAMNAAYLVPVDDELLLAEVERLRGEHTELAFEVTGPWAPYNFVETAEG